MPAYNRTILIGNICADLELRSGAGTSVTTIRLAVDDSYKSKTGEKVERTVFVDVDVWGSQAESAAKYLSKGSPVMVEGRLQMDSWTDKETGQKRTRLKVRADRVQFLAPRGEKPPADPSAASNLYAGSVPGEDIAF
jgi:single-strand DNA-binding protein